MTGDKYQSRNNSVNNLKADHSDIFVNNEYNELKFITRDHLNKNTVAIRTSSILKKPAVKFLYKRKYSRKLMSRSALSNSEMENREDSFDHLVIQGRDVNYTSRQIASTSRKKIRSLAQRNAKNIGKTYNLDLKLFGPSFRKKNSNSLHKEFSSESIKPMNIHITPEKGKRKKTTYIFPRKYILRK
mmetsp:Transcript_23522/g.20875  ORF Transcript_23522/g.20875 Transcript_23522/m.20875 type:complete len:186 (+) Transcript_23522:203-760(+)